MAIPQIAPVDNPLLVFLTAGAKLVLFLTDDDGIVLLYIVELSKGVSLLLSSSSPS
jgi:hypothetical protein